MQTSPDRVREVIHNFNRMGMACLDPRWAGGRPRRISPEDERFIVQTATTRPEKLGIPFTHWSIQAVRVPGEKPDPEGGDRPGAVAHTVLTRRLHAYLRWRNANARDPRVLEAERKRRAELRAEKLRRWGRPAPRGCLILPDPRYAGPGLGPARP